MKENQFPFYPKIYGVIFLQNISQLVHSRHRSVTNFMVNINIIAGLIAHSFQEKKLSLKLDKDEEVMLPVLGI